MTATRALFDEMSLLRKGARASLTAPPAARQP